MTTFGIAVALVLAQTAPAPAPAAAPAGASTLAATPERASTLTLEDALREAQAKNQDLKVARARLDQSRELGNQAWSFQLPQVTASGSFTHNNFSDVTLPAGAFGAGSPPVLLTKQDQLAAQIQGTLPLVAPQTWYGIGAARAGERVAAENVEGTRRDVLFGAAQAYYGAANFRQVVRVQERQLAIALDREKDARVRYDVGTTTKVSLLRAEIDRARAEQDLKRAQNAYAGAKEALAALLDRRQVDFEVDIPGAPKLPDPASMEGAALHDRPDVRAAQEQITVAQRNRDGVMARYLPVLAAFGRYQYTNAAGFTGDTTTWAIGLQASWNIFDGLLRESELRENEARIREAEASRSSTEIKARSEVRQARLDLDSAVANREKAKEQTDLARENQRLVDVNFKAGAATYLEVSDANATLLSAELSAVSEALNADLSALRLLKAAGAFDPR